MTVMADFFYRKRNKPFFILDVEDNFVKGLILKKENAGLTLLANSRKDYSDLATGMKETIDEAYNQYMLFQDEDNITLSEIPLVLSLPSDILRAKVVSFDFKRNDNILISKPEETSLVKRVINKTKYEIGKEFLKDSGILPSDIKYISFKLVKRNINGYDVRRLFKLNGKELSFETLGVYLTKEDFNNIRSIVDGLGLHLTKIVHIAEALADEKISYPLTLNHITNLPNNLKKSEYTPTLLMSYYAKEIF